MAKISLIFCAALVCIGTLLSARVATQEVFQSQNHLLSGGLTADRPADASTQAVADQVMGAVQSLLQRTFTKFALQSYRSQVVSGTNYYMKVLAEDTANGQYVIHLKVYQPIGGDASLTGIQFPKMWDDPITFDGYSVPPVPSDGDST